MANLGNVRPASPFERRELTHVAQVAGGHSTPQRRPGTGSV